MNFISWRVFSDFLKRLRSQEAHLKAILDKRDKDGCPGPDRVCVALVASDRLYFRS